MNLPFFVLDLGLHIIDGIRGLHLEGDSLAGEGLYEDLHTGCSKCSTVRGGCGEGRELEATAAPLSTFIGRLKRSLKQLTQRCRTGIPQKMLEQAALGR
jgi:hypothetical protein